MKDYLIAWVLTGLITVAGLFGVGFVVGLIGAITGSISDPNKLEQSAAFNVLVIVAIVVVSALVNFEVISVEGIKESLEETYFNYFLKTP